MILPLVATLIFSDDLLDWLCSLLDGRLPTAVIAATQASHRAAARTAGTVEDR